MGRQITDRCRIAPIHLHAVAVAHGGKAVQAQRFGDAGFVRDQSARAQLIDGVLCHVSVGRPLAAGDGHQAGFGKQDGVIARQRFGGAVAPFDQRPQTRKDAPDVARLWSSGQVFFGVRQHKLNLGCQRARLEFGPWHAGIGRTNHDTIVPRQGKQDPPIGGFGDHDGMIAGQEASIDDDMDPLTRGDQCADIRLVHAPHGIDKYPGRVDDRIGVCGVGLSRLAVGELYAADFAVGMHQSRHRHVIDQRCTVVECRAHQGDCQPTIVELTVKVHHAAFESRLAQRGGQSQ